MGLSDLRLGKAIEGMRTYINLGLGLPSLPQGTDNAPFIRSITHAPDQT
jgi:hypothetical protein